MKFLVSWIVFFFCSHALLAQQKDIFTEISTNKIIPIDSIRSVEIYNSWTGKRWTLSQKGLNHLKTILMVSKATKMSVLKPGHFFMKINFSNPQTLKEYDFYMYSNGIFLDPDYLSKKPVYSINLKNAINWNKLK